MFKKDDYIVIKTSDLNSHTNAYLHECVYKISEDYHYMRSIDSNGEVNGWSSINFDKSKNRDFDWRYATQFEITKYKELGKPFKSYFELDFGNIDLKEIDCLLEEFETLI